MSLIDKPCSLGLLGFTDVSMACARLSHGLGAAKLLRNCSKWVSRNPIIPLCGWAPNDEASTGFIWYDHEGDFVLLVTFGVANLDFAFSIGRKVVELNIFSICVVCVTWFAYLVPVILQAFMTLHVAVVSIWNFAFPLSFIFITVSIFAGYSACTVLISSGINERVAIDSPKSLDIFHHNWCIGVFFSLVLDWLQSFFVSKRRQNDLVYHNLYKFSGMQGTRSSFVCVYHHNSYICLSRVSCVF